MVVVGRKNIEETQLQTFAGKYTASSTTKIVVRSTGEPHTPRSKKKETQMESNLNETQKRPLLGSPNMEKNEGDNDGCKQDLKTFGPECSQNLFGKDAIVGKTTKDKSLMDMEDMETQVVETLSVEEKPVTMSGEGKQTERRKSQPNDDTYQRNRILKRISAK